MFVPQRGVFVFVVAAFLLSSTCAPLPSEAQAAAQDATSTPTITGTVVDIQNSLPVSGAEVLLERGSTTVAQGVTNGDGSVSFPNEPPGVYHLEIRARGYSTGRSEDIVVNPGARSADVRLTLQRASLSTDSSALRQIGRVSNNSQRTQLQSTSTITQDISPERLQLENYVRVGDALTVLPGVDASQDSAVGDDLYVSLRGIGGSETQILLDGHPIGPFGATGGGGTSGGNFNLQLTPFWALRNVNVIYGSGAESLYGTDALAGAIDLQTLNPTRTPQATVLQGFGNQGKSESALTATGTVGRLGYVVEGSTQGTYGQFKPANVLQTGFLAGSQDFTTANINSLGADYSVSANYLLRDSFAKLQYSFSPNSSLSLQYYTSGSTDDKTGNGDNDAFGGAYSYYNTINGSLLAGGPGTLVAAPNGSTPCAPIGGNAKSIPVVTNGGTSCLSPSQYAAATQGPDGGGGGRWQWEALRDATLRYDQAFAGNNHFNASLFTDSYEIDTTRYPNTRSSKFRTFGLQLSDDVITSNNDFGFGFFSPHERATGSQTVGANLVDTPDLGQVTKNFFLRDNLQVDPKLSIFSNLWIKQSTVTNSTLLDPRLSLVFRPTRNDVIRLTGARASNSPDVTVTQGTASFSDPGSINPSCNALTGIGSIPGSNLVPETAKSLELALGHRFHDDTQIQIAFYDENVSEQLIGTSTSLSSVPQFLNDPGFIANFGAYLTRYNRTCGTNITTPQQFANVASVGGTLNAAQGQYKGIEISGRARVNRHIFFDYTYDLQSAQFLGLDNATLLANGSLINGVQIEQVPLQKASLGVDVSDGHGLDVRVDGFHVGNNNGYNRPAYTFFNGGVSKQFRTGTTLTFGVQNIFNSASTYYGLIGDGTYYGYNPVYAAAQAAGGSPVATTNVANGNEEFGLPPRALIFTLSQRVGGF